MSYVFASKYIQGSISEIPIIADERCDCLERTCAKRYFLVFNYKLGEYVRVEYCKEFVRNTIHNLIPIKQWYSNSDICHCIKIILQKHIEFSYTSGSRRIQNDILNYSVSIPYCERPHVRQEIKFKDLLSIYVEEKPFNNTYYQAIKRTIINYFSIDLYKKYKTKYAEVRKIFKKNKYDISDEEVIELINILYQIQIKEK